MKDAGITDEEHSRLVTVANGPPNEVGVGLAAESGFDYVFDKRQGRGVGRVLECVEDGGAGAVGDIEFAGRGGGEVM